MSLLSQASLILTPNAYKEGKLYSVIPSDGSGDFTFTRATTATRVNSDGLVELVPYNLLTQTNDLNGWGLLNSSRTTGQSNPFGSNDAIKLTYNTTSSAHYIFKSSPSTGQVTISIYAKANELNFLQIASAQNAEEYANFNLGSGVVGTKGTICSSSSIESVGDGWYRCAATLTNGTNSVYFCIVNSATSNWFASSGYAGANNTDGLFLWGSQLVQGSTALPYQKTETRLNIPRLDYSNGTCPSILLEPQRTNLLQQSSSFDNVYWGKGNVSVSANTTTAPDGTLTADKIIENTSNSNHEINHSNVPLSASSYSYSVYAKADGRNWIALSIQSQYTFFDLQNGVVGSSAVGNVNDIKSVGNGWYRCTITRTAAAANNFGLIRLALDDNTPTYTGDGTSGIYLWGAQLEAGSYATSYIPTTTASVTRNAEVLSKTGISSLLNPSEGTLYIEAQELFDNSTKYMQISDNSDNNNVNIQFISNTIRLETRGGGAIYRALNIPSNIYQNNKIAISWKAGNIIGFVNGTKYILTLASGSGNGIPNALNRFDFSYYWGGFPFYSNTKQATIWKSQLTDDQLAQLTTI